MGRRTHMADSSMKFFEPGGSSTISVIVVKSKYGTAASPARIQLTLERFRTCCHLGTIIVK